MKRMTSGRFLTVEDILSDSRYERGELWDGHFVVREPSGGSHGDIGANLAFLLMCEPSVRAFGRVRDASAGYVVSRDPDRVLSPDVSLISFARCPTIPQVAFVEGTPELVVEVRSPRDSWISAVEKGGVWIGHGARLVWCVDPQARSVLVMRPGQEPTENGVDAVLALEPLLDVEIPVSDIFATL